MGFKNDNQINLSYLWIYATCTEKYNSYWSMFINAFWYFSKINEKGSYKMALITSHKDWWDKEINELKEDTSEANINAANKIIVLNVDSEGILISDITETAKNGYSVICIDDIKLINGDVWNNLKKLSAIAELYNCDIRVATSIPNDVEPNEIHWGFANRVTLIKYSIDKDDREFVELVPESNCMKIEVKEKDKDEDKNTNECLTIDNIEGYENTKI